MGASKLRVVLSILLYILLFYSIFDVYYTSPLVHGIKYERPSVPSLANTVVVIVADGLRYDKLFANEMKDAPILRNIMLNRGSWGFSHTRVPTESRPGHVALFAGFYEDVAAITKGWQANPVEFDSIFNRSYQAFAWGGPDVIPLFQPPDRVGDPRVMFEKYPHIMLDFTAENITQVDDWVVDRFSDFMKTSYPLLLNSPPSESADDGFRKGNFIFLHLSAADQMGHTQKPHSKAYTNMIRNLDANVGRLLRIFDKHPAISQETAFIFTSDHGMTDWGSHGSGSSHETVTPLIVWGKHIPRPLSNFQPSDLSPLKPGLKRHDIRQADICPLIACLLGIPIPANSVGELPLDLLDVDLQLKVEFIRENALHILKQLQIKYAEQKANHYSFFFREFGTFTQKQMAIMLETATLQATKQDYAAAIETYRKIIRLGLEGLNYYHKYDRIFMGEYPPVLVMMTTSMASFACGFSCLHVIYFGSRVLCITLSYVIWTLLLWIDGFGPSHPKSGQNEPTKTRLNFWTLFLSLCAAVFFFSVVINARHQSLLRTFYQILPLVLCLIMFLVPRYRQGLSTLIQDISSSWANGSNRKVPSYCPMFPLLLLLTEFGLWGFVYRFLLSAGAILLGTWPYLDSTFITSQNRPLLRRIWACSCCVLAVFPSLPMVGTFFSPTLALFSSICVSMAVLFFLRACRGTESVRLSYKEPNSLLIFGAFFSGLMVFLVRILVSWSFSIPTPVHLICWALLVISPLIALFGKTLIVRERLVALTLAFFIPFNLMNVSYEGFFFLALATVVFMWAWLESGQSFDKFFSSRLRVEPKSKFVRMENSYRMESASLRRPFFYVFFVIYSFFGTGNIASVNTFDPISVYCLMTVLNPAAMGSLLIFKILCPIILVGMGYALIGRVRESLERTTASTIRGRLKPETTILMMIANFLAVHFFGMLKDEGSWLDIGESISHYVIAVSIGLASVLLSHFGSWMLSPSWNEYHFDIIGHSQPTKNPVSTRSC